MKKQYFIGEDGIKRLIVKNFFDWPKGTEDGGSVCLVLNGPGRDWKYYKREPNGNFDPLSGGVEGYIEYEDRD